MATLLNIKRVRIILGQLPALGVPKDAVKPLKEWADREEGALRKAELEKLKASIPAAETEPETEPETETETEPEPEPEPEEVKEDAFARTRRGRR